MHSFTIVIDTWMHISKYQLASYLTDGLYRQGLNIKQAQFVVKKSQDTC